MATVAPITVDESTFESEVLNAEKPVLVDFWAAWCGPCRLVSPVVESIGDKHADKISVAKVNTDDNQQLAMRYSIFSIPTLILFENGREAARLVGYMPQEVMEERLSQFLAWPGRSDPLWPPPVPMCTLLGSRDHRYTPPREWLPERA